MDAWTRRAWLGSAVTAWAVSGGLGQDCAVADPPVDRAIELIGQEFPSENQPLAGHHQPFASRVTTLAPIDEAVRRVVVTAMAADPRGQLLAVAGDDHVIRILNVETMRLLHTLGNGRQDRMDDQRIGSEVVSVPGTGHTDLIRTLAFDSEGDRLVSAGNDGRLIVWDRRRNFRVMQEIGSAPALACVQFHPTIQQMAAVGFDREVFLISRTAASTPRLRCDCNDLRCCRYRHRDGLLAVAGRDGHVHLFDPTTGVEQKAKSATDRSFHQGRIRSMVFRPESSGLVSVSEDGTLVERDTVSLQLTSRLTVTSGRLFSVVLIDRDHAVAAGSDDRLYVIRLSDSVTKAKVIETLSGHVGSVATLAAVGPTLFSGGFDATIRRWDLTALSGAASKIARGRDNETDAPETSPR
ncbi:MAG: WD40 repeat domain-containing protein [Planctomycetota bacterium]